MKYLGSCLQRLDYYIFLLNVKQIAIFVLHQTYKYNQSKCEVFWQTLRASKNLFQNVVRGKWDSVLVRLCQLGKYTSQSQSPWEWVHLHCCFSVSNPFWYLRLNLHQLKFLVLKSHFQMIPSFVIGILIYLEINFGTNLYRLKETCLFYN